eukprot:768276-Hanusia_phi.AAC.5
MVSGGMWVASRAVGVSSAMAGGVEAIPLVGHGTGKRGGRGSIGLASIILVVAVVSKSAVFMGFASSADSLLARQDPRFGGVDGLGVLARSRMEGDRMQKLTSVESEVSPLFPRPIHSARSSFFSDPAADGVLANLPSHHQPDMLDRMNKNHARPMQEARMGQRNLPGDGALMRSPINGAAVDGSLSVNFKSDQSNARGALASPRFKSSYAWATPAHDDGWSVSYKSDGWSKEPSDKSWAFSRTDVTWKKGPTLAETKGALFNSKDSDSNGVLASMQADPETNGALAGFSDNDSQGSLAQIKQSDVGGSLFSVSKDSRLAGGDLMFLSKRHLKNDNVIGSLSDTQYKDKHEQIDGSLAASRGSNAGGSLQNVDADAVDDNGELASLNNAPTSVHVESSAKQASKGYSDVSHSHVTSAHKQESAIDKLMKEDDATLKKIVQMAKRKAKMLEEKVEESKKVQHERVQQHKLQQKKSQITSIQVADKPQARTEHLQKQASRIHALHKVHKQNLSVQRDISQSDLAMHNKGTSSLQAGSNSTGSGYEDEDIGWEKHRWNLTTWVVFIMAGPVFTSVMTGIVGHTSGFVAAACTCIILVCMDIAAYYYSWFIW